MSEQVSNSNLVVSRAAESLAESLDGRSEVRAIAVEGSGVVVYVADGIEAVRRTVAQSHGSLQGVPVSVVQVAGDIGDVELATQALQPQLEILEGLGVLVTKSGVDIGTGKIMVSLQSVDAQAIARVHEVLGDDVIIDENPWGPAHYA
jgi:hypothetical protein